MRQDLPPGRMRTGVREHKNPDATRGRLGLGLPEAWSRVNIHARPQPVSAYQFKVVLRGIDPMMWLPLPLHSDQSVTDLHQAIWIALGRSDSPLYRLHNS